MIETDGAPVIGAVGMLRGHLHEGQVAVLSAAGEREAVFPVRPLAEADMTEQPDPEPARNGQIRDVDLDMVDHGRLPKRGGVSPRVTAATAAVAQTQ
jgi:hypothetical protein